MSTKKATTAAAAKKLTKTKQKKKGRRTYRNPWRRSPSERATEDALYLRELIPVMRELGVSWFADIELGPLPLDRAALREYIAGKIPGTTTCGQRGEGGRVRTCVLPYGHKGKHKEADGSRFGEDLK
jgi:hypothetical protein